MRDILYRTKFGEMLAGDLIRDHKNMTATSAKFLADRIAMQDKAKASGKDKDMRKDFFTYILRGTDEENSAYTPGELARESNLLLVAGSDTTATTLAGVFYYLLRHPAALEKLRAEIEANFSSWKEINHAGTSLSSLPYLRAVIDETMRLAPPVPGVLPRDVIREGATIDSQFYPAGTELGVPIYALHHNESYYPEPFSFKPERWIVDKATGVTKEDVEVAQSAFTPFSIGHRGCIGKNLAYVELTIAVARAVSRFEMEEVEGWMGKAEEEIWGKDGGRLSVKEGEYRVRDGFVAKKDGPWVRFRERSQ
jgi:cytochrome P450